MFIDLTGRRFSRLTVISMAKGRRSIVHWLCRCDCGKERCIRTAHLNNGNTRSCGCLQRDMARSVNTKHGDCASPEYTAWLHMKARCLKSNHPEWRNYGGRGIKIYQHWLHSYKVFLADMGRRPSPQYSLDRIDNNGDYTPNNCRWATIKQQASNTRKNFTIQFRGEMLHLMEWARRFKINHETLRCRLLAGIPMAIAIQPGFLRWKKAGRHL